MPKEEEQFLSDLKGEDPKDPFQSEVEKTDDEKEEKDSKPTQDGAEDTEDVSDSIKNRRHRRIEQRLKEEREANIALAETIRQQSELLKEKNGEAAEYLKEISRIYGTDSPEAVEATTILQKALNSVRDSAIEEAKKAFREEQTNYAKELKEQEKKLDSMVEEIEEEFGVSMTPEMEKGFFRMLEKISPKDEDGKIIAFADHITVWEEYQAKLDKRKSGTRAKEVASRSLVRGASANDNKLSDDVAERWLRENGII